MSENEALQNELQLQKNQYEKTLLQVCDTVGFFFFFSNINTRYMISKQKRLKINARLSRKPCILKCYM
jgi:hypothetical protein